MQSFRQSLPPLDLLVAFEAAARLESFTLAAGELNVTQSAVSQQIRALERHLGADLFARGHRSVRLTVRGVEFQQGVTVALAHLAGAAGQVARSEDDAQATLACDHSFAELWLAPRLRSALGDGKGFALRLVASDAVSDSFADDIDVAVVHGDGHWPGYDAEMFIEEAVFPICAPDYLKTSGGLRSLDDLADACLLDLEYRHWNWMNWNIWLTERGRDPLTHLPRLVANSYPVLIDAARRGLGVALGWAGFVEEDLRAGRLVAPLDERVTTARGYHLIVKHNRPMSPAADELLAWLRAEGGLAAG